MAIVFRNWSAPVLAYNRGYQLLSRRVMNCFAGFQRMSSLKVNVAKTFIIPLGTSDNDFQLRNFLLSSLSLWKSAQVVSSARYLGLIMGPLVSLEVQ